MFKNRLFYIVLFIILIILSLGFDARKDVNLISIFSFDKEAIDILLLSRIPSTLTIILTAASLSVAGLIMQSIGRNKFISPSIAGSQQSSILGLLIAYLFITDAPLWGQFIFSFIFSLIASFFFISFIQKLQFKNEIYVPLIGLMFGAMIGSLSMLIAQLTNTQQLLAVLGVGSFANKTIGTFELILFTVPALILSFIYAQKFNIVALGEDFSLNLGINYKRVLSLGIIIVSLISASTFIVVGSLPFLGLIIPNIVSILYGDNIKKNIWDIALFGSIFVLICDLVARLGIYVFTGLSYEISIGFIMGLVGSLIFLGMIFREVKHA
ncbi:iron chelate uptake ABC transporter family permease subunit [Acholeplasma equirhinis]|uniref:ABC transporter permease n=1 Tax=Acholeplasma equirhinis TaxID=555393 RepID=UPI00197AE3E9|nr:iron chelate uptake ABC transporter family permease subunit [Acholeplasma equirhinis]MBN3491019.1 iron chelate uptake ABC transporter family permease subunit [Acholeplasma equirhinis]